MTSTNAFQYEMWFERALGLLNDWKKHKAGDHEVQEAYPLEYIGANLVEQVERIWRLNLSSEQVEELNQNFLPCLEEWRGNLLEESLKGAEVVSFEALLDDVFDSIDFSLKVEEDPELDFDLKDEITDCLVKRDGLHLIMKFVERESAQLQGDFKSKVMTLIDERMAQISKLDKRIKESIDVFALVSDFCQNYIGANKISDDNSYWWLFEPINRAMDATIVSLLSLKSRFLTHTADQQLKDLTAFLNAEVQRKKSESTPDAPKENDESPEEEILREFPTREIDQPSEVKEEALPYALAADSEISTELQPAVYALVVNTSTKGGEHHRIRGAVGTDYRPSKYFDKDTLRVFDETPAIAEQALGIQKLPYSVSLSTTSEGCKGRSLGLAAMIEYLRATKFRTITCPIAATGVVEFDGDITRVDNIALKVDHAIKSGFEVIFVPKENLSELSNVERGEARLMALSTVREIADILSNLSEGGQQEQNKIRDELLRIRSLLINEGLEASEVGKTGWMHFLDVTSVGQSAKVVIYSRQNGTFGPPIIQSKAGSELVERIRKIIGEEFENMEPSSSSSEIINVSIKILRTDARRNIREYLAQVFKDSISENHEANCDFRFDIEKGDKVIVKQFSSGTLNISGKTGQLFDKVVSSIEAVSGLKLALPAKKPTQSTGEPMLPAGITTWIGVDEAGKGDYFGPLVTASVLVDPSNIEQLSMLGIRDSKAQSDTKNIELGEKIRSICEDKCYVLVTMPEKYNELMEQPSFKRDSQRLLAWQHRRAIENILLKYECKYAICDQFGHEDLIKEGLKTGKGTQIEIIQRPKAESNLAVAAASVLARREFLLRLQKMSSDYGVNFPKGASDFDSILKAALMLIEKNGKNILAKVAKVHFKTTKKIMEQLGQ